MGPLEATAPIEGTSREETVGRDSDRKSVGAAAFGPPAAPFSIYSLTRLAGSSRGNGADQTSMMRRGQKPTYVDVSPPSRSLRPTPTRKLRT